MGAGTLVCVGSIHITFSDCFLDASSHKFRISKFRHLVWQERKDYGGMITIWSDIIFVRVSMGQT